MKRSEIKRRPLAATTIENLEPKEKEYLELHADGVYLQVRPNGKKAWKLSYKKANGKWSWLGLGSCGNVPHQLTGKQALEKAAQIKREAAESGADALLSKRAKAAQELDRQRDTFEQLAEEWLEGKRKGWTEGTYKRNSGGLRKHVEPAP